MASESAENRIAVAGAGQVSHVARLLAEFHDHLDKPRPSLEELEDSVRHVMEGGDGEFLLGFVGEEPAGFVQLRWRWAVWTRALDGWLEDLFVSKRFRRSGLGRALGEATIERARELGCVRLELDVDADNEAALTLYRKLGFSDNPKGEAESRLMGLRVDGS
jgi:GNAT superfamily N-acetyltransferase